MGETLPDLPAGVESEFSKHEHQKGNLPLGPFFVWLNVLGSKNILGIRVDWKTVMFILT